MSKKIEDFVTQGECVDVSLPDEVKNDLFPYHPAVLCKEEARLNYGAFTKLDILDSDIIRLNLYPQWSKEHFGKIASLEFKISKLEEDVIVAIPKPRLKITESWYIEKWEIKSKKSSKNYCKNKYIKPNIMIDTISWVHIDSEKTIENLSELKGKNEDSIKKSDLVNIINGSIRRIDTEWIWIDQFV